MLEYVYKYNQKHPESAIRIRGHVFTWHSQTPEWFSMLIMIRTRNSVLRKR